MRRGHDNHSLGNRVALVAGALVLASTGVLLLTQLATIRRYFKMRTMSARRHPKPPGTMSEGTESQPRWGTSHWPVH